MLLAVDIGNSNIVLGFLDDNTIVDTYRITTTTSHTVDEYGLLFTQFLNASDYTFDDVDDVIISSVVPKVLESVTAAIRKYFDIKPLIIGPGIKTGLNIHIDDPRSLGADMLCGCAGAYYTYGGPALVVDFGTATTYCYVDGHGSIRAGIITTGMNATANALWSSTAQLPEVEITRPTSILATNTKTAMQAGLYYSFLGAMEGTVMQFRDEIDEDFKVIATGGLANLFADDTEFIDIIDPDLVLKGMAILYHRNARAK